MKVMLLEQKPTTYGIDRQIKTQIVRGGAKRRLSLFGFYVLIRMATAIVSLLQSQEQIHLHCHRR